MTALWTITEHSFDAQQQHHKETIFTIGNGYLSTRGTLEESYPSDRPATFIHGVFDAAPIVVTELANAPDWTALTLYLDGERFSLATGQVEAYERTLDLRTGVLHRRVRWRSPSGRAATLTFERFASLADTHTLYLRCQIVPEFDGFVEVRAGLHGCTDNEGLAHWHWQGQGRRGEVAYLHTRTRASGIDLAGAVRLRAIAPPGDRCTLWDVENAPTLVLRLPAEPGRELEVEKVVAYVTSRDALAQPQGPIEPAIRCAQTAPAWPQALAAQAQAWAQEWERCDVEIEGDDEAQRAIRFNLFQMLIAAPRHDDRVSIGAKTLSGFGYRGHVFWDTEIFMLPLFTYTAPNIARNLLNYRYHTLPAARAKAQANGYAGAQFAWESADTGEEVTPTWVPHFADRARLVRIWTGDIELHISADIAYAAWQYWQVTGDDAWLIERGAELILDTAKFWASRAEWNAAAGRYEYTDVIGPDEYHDHVDNNAYTNRLAQWNLHTALVVLGWLREQVPAVAEALTRRLDLSAERLAHWREVMAHTYVPQLPTGLIEQFEGYSARRDVDLASLEPRTRSLQEIFGIEGANETQAIKQPDVLMLLYLLRGDYSEAVVRANYDYYAPRTDHTYGSSLGPAIMAIMACEVGRPDEAYTHFIRAARADLDDVRGNARDGIHAASAAGTWQAVAFGFGGLRVTAEGWQAQPRLPSHWKRLRWRFFHRGQPVVVDLRPASAAAEAN